MPEWAWGLVAGVIASGVGAFISGVVQVWLRKVELRERRGRDAARAALDIMGICEKTGVESPKMLKEFGWLRSQLLKENK